jgi:hypothetical protein
LKLAFDHWFDRYTQEPAIRGRRGPCVRGRVIVALLVMLVLLSDAPSLCPQASPPSEYQVKAAFLFNFAKFIDWPQGSFASPQSPFSICILGKDPFGRSIDDSLRGKTIGDHPVNVLRVKDTVEARRCQILFASAVESRNISGILGGLHGTSVLLVGEADGFAASGGTIQFTLEENHVRFLINTDAADRAGLKFSSKLLALAKIVHDTSSEGKS